MRIRVIWPLVGESLTDAVRAEAEHWAGPDVEIDVVSLEQGTESIESSYDEAFSVPGILDRVRGADTEDVDAVFISCFGDPGVPAAREITDLPVAGGFEPAVYAALGLGDQIGIITMLPNVVPLARSLVRRHGMGDRVGAIGAIDMPVLELAENQTELLDRLHRAAIGMISAGQAEVIVLGCTGMLGVARLLQERLEKDGLRVPVVDPTAAAINWLTSTVRMGLSSSRLTYLAPPTKLRTASSR